MKRCRCDIKVAYSCSDTSWLLSRCALAMTLGDVISFFFFFCICAKIKRLARNKWYSVPGKYCQTRYVRVNPQQLLLTSELGWFEEPGGPWAQARYTQGAAVARTQVPKATARAADEPDRPPRPSRAPRPPRVKPERADRLHRRRLRGVTVQAAQHLRMLPRHGVRQFYRQLQKLGQIRGQSFRLGIRWVSQDVIRCWIDLFDSQFPYSVVIFRFCCHACAFKFPSGKRVRKGDKTVCQHSHVCTRTRKRHQ